MAGHSFNRGARVANAHIAVTPSDVTELPSTTVALWVGGAGNVDAVMWGGTDECAYDTVAAGSYLEGNFRYVKASTTATLIVAQYAL